MSTDAPGAGDRPAPIKHAHDPWSDWPTDSPDYPRRQLQREHWLNLNGDWHFTFDPDGRASHPRLVAEWDQTIRVPFAPESKASGIGDTSFHPDAWYARDFDLELGQGQRAVLHFGAVDYEAEVWVDDVLVGRHEGGHTPFAFDVTGALAEGRTHTVTVWAHDNPHNLAKPRGKQDWLEEPHLIWYPRTTGIWQTVWLEVVPETRIAHVRFTSSLTRWEIDALAVIEGRREEPLRLRARFHVG